MKSRTGRRGPARNLKQPGFSLLTLIALQILHGIASAQADSIPDADVIPGDLPAFVRSGDSLQLRLIDIDSERLADQFRRTDLWHRLIPAIHLTASFGWRDLIVLDPATNAPSVFPKDAYRISVGISLGEVLNDSKGAEAKLGLKRINIIRQQLIERLKSKEEFLRRDLDVAGAEREALLREDSILGEVGRFNELRFHQGELRYDALARSRIDLIEAEKKIRILDCRIHSIRSQLRLRTPSTGVIP